MLFIISKIEMENKSKMIVSQEMMNYIRDVAIILSIPVL